MKLKDYPSALMLAFAIAASVLTILNAIYFSQRYSMEEEANNRYDYAMTFEVFYDGDANSEDYPSNASLVKMYVPLIEGFKSFENANITLHNCYMRVGSMNENFGVDIIMNEAEELKYGLSDGEGFSQQETENQALIGDGFLAYTYEVDDKTYIDIFDEPFFVAGVLENEAATGLDERAVVKWEYTSEAFREKVFYTLADRNKNFWGNVFMVDTDRDYHMAEDEWESLLAESELSYETTERESENDSIYGYYAFVKNTILFMAVIFAGGSCICASIIWINRRHRELVVRRIFGYSFLDLLGVLFKELIVIFIMGILSGALIFCCIQLLNHESIAIIMFSLKSILTFFAGMGLLMLAILAISIVNAVVKNPIHGLRG